MRKLLERSVASVDQRLVLLAPPHIDVPDCFRNVTVDSAKHDQLVRDMQRLRGRIYLDDGAIQSEQLSSGGLHRTAEDARSWHLVMLNPNGDVSSCAWYMEHDESAGFDDLRVSNCPLTRLEGSRDRLWHAVESELGQARREGLRYAEVGGWAVSERSRCTSEGLVLALIWYSLGRTLGDALGITTATVRHSSSTILRRLGGSHLEFEGQSIPSYYDPKYDCEMELLRFDSRKPNPKYKGLIDMLGRQVTNALVVASPMHEAALDRYASAGSAAQPQFAA